MKRRVYRYKTIGSTNDEAKRLAALGEAHGAVVVADSQTAGRGRSGRQWLTPPGSAIAMTLILRPTIPAFHLGGIAMLGGLAVLEGIQTTTGLRPQLKWPNDVLIGGKKVAGVLAEAVFIGEELDSVVLGMGVNVNASPPPDLALSYPATSLAAEAGHPLDREPVMQSSLAAFDMRYPQLGSPGLVAAWREHLAMLGQRVQVGDGAEGVVGFLEGVTGEGALVLRLENGETRTLLAGELHLRQL
jgi:BirA family biotin operon repressor/biotin-[acetyl-CoA-carboxylase] ligase